MQKRKKQLNEIKKSTQDMKMEFNEAKHWRKKPNRNDAVNKNFNKLKQIKL